MSAEPSCEILRLGRDRALCLQRLDLDKLSLSQTHFSNISSNRIAHQERCSAGKTHQKHSSQGIPFKVFQSRHSGHLPTGLSNSRNAALIGELPETNTADAKLPVDGTGPTAQHATLHLAG
jgi:hypothetical protein